jgi:hypothetical protein
MDDYLEDRLFSLPFTCPLVTLSEIIAEHRLETIDLIKIDVQKSELAVLEGLREEDWRRVMQIVIEVHDHGGRVEHIRRLLAARGFEIHVVQDDHYEGSEMYNLYAARTDRRRELTPQPAASRETSSAQKSTAQKSTVVDRAARQKQAWKRPPRAQRPRGSRKR